MIHAIDSTSQYPIMLSMLVSDILEYLIKYQLELPDKIWDVDLNINST